MTDRQLVALIAAILIGQRGNGVFIDEQEAVSDAIAIIQEASQKYPVG